MKEQDYKKNYISYGDVVRQGRISRELSRISHELDSIENSLSALIGDSKMPKSFFDFKLFLNSLALQSAKKFDDLLVNHIEFLKSR